MIVNHGKSGVLRHKVRESIIFPGIYPCDQKISAGPRVKAGESARREMKAGEKADLSKVSSDVLDSFDKEAIVLPAWYPSAMGIHSALNPA